MSAPLVCSTGRISDYWTPVDLTKYYYPTNEHALRSLAAHHHAEDSMGRLLRALTPATPPPTHLHHRRPLDWLPVPGAVVGRRRGLLSAVALNDAGQARATSQPLRSLPNPAG